MINKKSNVDEKAAWKTQKENLRTKFSNVTDEDLNYDQSKKQEMLGKLATKLDKTTAELLAVLEKN